MKTLALLSSAAVGLLLMSSATASRYARPLTPAELTPLQHASEFIAAGEAASKMGNYAEAENDFKNAKALMNWNLYADRGLAEVYVSEGRYEEASQLYRALLTPNPHVVSTATQEVRTHMGFAIALSQAGRWPEAVAVYENILPKTINGGEAPKINLHFDPLNPMPAQLQALAHVAIGAEYLGNGARGNAFDEFGKALRTDPTSPFANYYYGYGWRSLDPADKARVLNAPQAKAALLRAEKMGSANVKAAAAKALKEMG